MAFFSAINAAASSSNSSPVPSNEAPNSAASHPQDRQGNNYTTVKGKISRQFDDPDFHLESLSKNATHPLLHDEWQLRQFTTITNGDNSALPSPGYQNRKIPTKQKKVKGQNEADRTDSVKSKTFPKGLPAWNFVIYQLLARGPPEGLKVSTLYRLGVHWCPGLENERDATDNQSCRAALTHGKNRWFKNVGSRWILKPKDQAEVGDTKEEDTDDNREVDMGNSEGVDMEDSEEVTAVTNVDILAQQPQFHGLQGIARFALAFIDVQDPTLRLPPIDIDRQGKCPLRGCADLLSI